MLIDVKHPPYPSLADLGYLLVYPFMYAGVVLLVRRQVRFSTGAWLDGAIGGLAAAALATAVLSPALIGLTKGDPTVVATNLAYPLGDVLLLSFLIAGFAIAGVRVGASWLLIGIGIATWGVADVVYLYQEATSSYDGGYLDSLWLVGGIAIAAAAALRTRPAVRERHESQSIFFPAMFAVIALSVAGLGPLRRPGRGLDLVRGRDAGRGGAAADAQLPREPRAAAGGAHASRSRTRSRASTTGAR